MDVTESLLPDPLFHPLPPSVDSLLTWFEELEYEGNQISFEWADNEIKNYLLGYVRVGLVAWRVKYYKLYRKGKKKFDSFRDYCNKGLGKSLWYINCLIKAGKVVLTLVKAGFTALPSCEAQARPLTQLKTEEEIIAKWQEVLDSAPAHRITSVLVTEIVEGEPEPKLKKIKLHASTYAQLQKKALESGFTTEELLDKLVQEYQPQDPEPPVEEDCQLEEAATEPSEERVPINPEELHRWQEDLQQLLIDRYGLSDRSHQGHDSS